MRTPTKPLAMAGQRGSAALARGGRRRGDLVERRPLDLTRLERLEHVALLDVVEAVEEDAALEPLGDLPRVVLEPLQLRDRRRVDDRAVADDAHPRVAPHDAVGDHAARDRAETRDLEQRPHLGLADRLLGGDGLQLADERLLDLLGELVDLVVEADLYALALRQA